MTTETVSNYVRDDYFARAHESEQLLIEMCQEGRTEFMTSERAFLAREMGWDEKQARKELTRVRQVLGLQGIAGRPQDRESALTECQVATDLLAKQGPKIQKEIEKQQAKLSGLERDASTSQRRVEQQADAVSQLRAYCPAGIKEKVKLAVNIVQAGIGQDLRDAKARHHELRCILNIGGAYEDQKKHLEFGLKNLLPAAVTEGVRNSMIQRTYSPEWPALKAECEQEYADLSERLPSLQDEHEEAIQAAELPLDFYSDPENMERN